MSQSDMLKAIHGNNLDELRTLLSTQKCSDTQDLRNDLLHQAVFWCKKAITEFLLQVGSNPNSKVYYYSNGRTALHIAGLFGDLGIIKMLLNHGADINAKDSEGASPLVILIKTQKEDAIEYLLERGARLFSDNQGRSPLHVAVTLCSLKIVKMLLQNGAPVNEVITSGHQKGYTPLHCACSSFIDDLDIIEFLLSNEAGVDLITEEGLTPLHVASEIGNVQLINLLLNHDSNINVRANHGYTPLYLAINRGNEDVALLLINRGAKVNDEFSNGKTILNLALEKRLSNTVKEILTRCCDPQGEIAKCKKVFQYFNEIQDWYIQIIESVLKNRLELTANFDDIINSSLHIAVESGRIESVEVLIAHGADVNAKDETGMTPLLYTVVDNDDFWTSLQISYEAAVKVAKMLLAAGADVNAATTTEKLTPLHVACEGSKAKLVQVLLDHNADVNLRDKNGKTALHFAASKCSNSTKLLLENNPNVNSQDFDGFTALHFAIDSKNYDVIELLLNFGADINIKDRNNHTPIDILNRCPIYYDDLICLTLTHAIALEAINLYYAKNSRSFFPKLDSTDQIEMESHFENCKQEIEKLKFVNVPGYNLTCYALMTRSIHSVASYVKNEDLITHFASEDFTTEFPIYAPIILGRLRNAFQRRPLTDGAGDFFNYYFQLPHVCVDHILSCLSSDDLMNVKDAM